MASVSGPPALQDAHVVPAGKRDGWSVVRAPSLEEEDARRLHRELERLKRERLAHRVRIQSLLVVQGIRVMSKDAAQHSLAALTAGRTLDIL